MGVPLPWAWSWNLPALIALVLAAALYFRGVRASRRAGGEASAQSVSSWRVLAFFLGLGSVFLALVSPIAVWSDMYLTAHVIQDTLLLFVAAPLVVLGAPLLVFWRAIPTGPRQGGLTWGLRHPRARRLALAVGHALATPRVAWAAFVVDFLAWHAPDLLDAALRSPVLREVVYVCFLGTGVLLWAHIFDTPPFHSRMGFATRAFYLLSAEISTKLVPLALVFATDPVYPHYAARLGVAEALADQVSAAGVLSIATILVVAPLFMMLLWRWLDADAESALTLPPGYRMRPLAPPAQPMFKGKPLRWRPIVMQGGAPPTRPLEVEYPLPDTGDVDEDDLPPRRLSSG